jgi:hypothetical protein
LAQLIQLAYFQDDTAAFALVTQNIPIHIDLSSRTPTAGGFFRKVSLSDSQ